MTSSTGQLDIASIAPIFELIKSAKDKRSRIDTILRNWTTVNEQFMIRLRQLGDGMEGDVENMKSLAESLMKIVNPAQKTASTSEAQTVATSTTKRPLTSTNQVEPIPQPKRLKTTEPKMAAARKFQLNWIFTSRGFSLFLRTN